MTNTIKKKHRILLIIANCALVIFFMLIILYPKIIQNISMEEILYASLLGLLGACLYLLYDFISGKNQNEDSSNDVDHEKKQIISMLVRVYLGPISGLLAYVFVCNSGFSSMKTWMPLLVGFSSDLMVGIINQLIQSVKYTLGIEKINENQSNSIKTTINKDT